MLSRWITLSHISLSSISVFVTLRLRRPWDSMDSGQDQYEPLRVVFSFSCSLEHLLFLAVAGSSVSVAGLGSSWASSVGSCLIIGRCGRMGSGDC